MAKSQELEQVRRFARVTGISRPLLPAARSGHRADAHATAVGALLVGPRPSPTICLGRADALTAGSGPLPMTCALLKEVTPDWPGRSSPGPRRRVLPVAAPLRRPSTLPDWPATAP